MLRSQIRIRANCYAQAIPLPLRVRIRITKPARTEPPRVPFSPVIPAARAPHSSKLGPTSQVAAGILMSRITGLLRERVIGVYFGVSPVLGVFRAAFKIPNLLSNLFGEGVLSAAFVTVYANLRAQGRDEESERLAASVFSLLACVCSVLVLLGVLLTPLLIDLIAPGFHGADRQLTIRLVRILFPSAGILVLSAWCLGVLNSHRRFLLSYSAQMAMNFAMISALVLFGRYLPQEQSAVILVVVLRGREAFSWSLCSSRPSFAICHPSGSSGTSRRLRRAPSFGISVPCSSAAASSKLAPISIRSLPAFLDR